MSNMLFPVIQGYHGLHQRQHWCGCCIGSAVERRNQGTALAIRPMIRPQTRRLQLPLDDWCRLVLPYNAVHSIQQTEQIPLQMGAKSTTTSNHPSIPCYNVHEFYLLKAHTQAKIIKQIGDFILASRLELQKFLNFCVAHLPVRLKIETKFLISYFGQPCQK